MTIITLTILNTYATFPLSQTPTRLKMTCCIMGLWWQQDYGMQFFRNMNIIDVQGSIYIGGGWKYMLEFNDFIYIVIFIIGNATFSFLMAHMTMCFYFNIANSIVKMVPLLIDLIISIKYVRLNQHFLTWN